MSTPFTLAVPQAELDDLQERLARTRWADAETVDDTSQGVRLEHLRDVVQHWQTAYDWRRLEARLNSLGQAKATIDGLGIHHLHVRSPEPGAMPLVLTHGWPGSVVEMLDVIGPLTDPATHGGDAADAFHVVVPSLPGYGWSDKPTTPGTSIDRIADLWAALMAQLGYDRYAAQGGDWGSMVTTAIGARDPEHVIGLHLNMAICIPDHKAELTDTEQKILQDLKNYQTQGSGYMSQQSTKPQTLGYGLVDSPVGQLAWILEKLWEWTDHDGDLSAVLSHDQVLDDVTTYWLTATGASSARLYWESARTPSWGPVEVPVGVSVFPKEIIRTTERFAAQRFPGLHYFHETTKGGHFAAWEQPAIFVDEVRASFRGLR